MSVLLRTSHRQQCVCVCVLPNSCDTQTQYVCVSHVFGSRPDRGVMHIKTTVWELLIAKLQAFEVL